MTLAEQINELDSIDLKAIMKATIASIEIVTDEQVEIEFDIFGFREKLISLLNGELP